MKKYDPQHHHYSVGTTHSLSAAGEPTDLEDESLELVASVGLLSLVPVQRVHEPRDHLRGEDGRVRLVEVLEITQSIHPPQTQGVDETTQVVESTEERLDLSIRESVPALTNNVW